MNATQLPLPTYTYGGHAPHRASDTSAAGARHIEPKRLTLQARVVLALYAQPGLSDEGLDRVLGTELGRSSRPRRRELELAGYVYSVGRCLGSGGVLVAMWALTADGEALARELST